ncbi:condensation domain-containing protein, partial [Flavitalea sp. BT771]
VRWLPDGNLEYIGRNDEQVKIRGHRVELSEIEQALMRLEGITQSCVLVKDRQVQSGRMKYLVGYYLSAVDTATPTATWIEEQLSKILPDYMIPDALIAMDTFPLTKNGKLDRNALPEPDFGPSEEYIAPRTAVEAAVRLIWEEVLGVEGISIKDNFFRIGGNSMLAITVIARIQKAFSVEITVKELFLNTTIDLLSILIQKHIDAEKKSPDHSHEIQPESLYGNESLYEALYSQNWRYSEYLAGSYSPMNLIIKKELGHVNEKAMSMAVDSLVSRHESLRTLFLRRDGKTMQKICSEQEFSPNLSLEDVCDHENKMDRIIAMVNELVTHRFDFQNEQAFKCKLIKYNTSRYVFIFVIDHIISDAQSTVIIEQELFSLYNAYCEGLANPLTPIKLQLKDYSYYHNQHYKGDKLARSQLYFRALFKDVPPKLRLKPSFFLDSEALHAELNASDVSVIPANSKGRGYVFTVPKEVLEEMKSLASEQNTSFFNLILVAYCLFLNRISGQFDFCIHSPMSTRNNEDYSKIIGWLTGELFLRVKINEDHTYKDLLRSTQDVITNSLDHIYYQDVVNLLNIEWDQLVTAQLNLINDISNPDATSADFDPVHYVAGHVSTSINFNVAIHENGISFNCTYKCAVIHPDQIAEICDVFVNVLRLVLKSPEIKMKYWDTTLAILK